MKFKSFLIAVFLVKSIFSIGQTVAPGTEFQELVKIADVYASIPNISFDMRFTFADSLTPNTLTDSMSLHCKISYGRTFVTNDEMEMLHGMEYDVFVDKEDSVIMASPARKPKEIFQIPLMDSLFRATYVDSMYIQELNDSTWKFIVNFTPDSYYFIYEMFYDPRTGLIKEASYHARNNEGNYDIPDDRVVCARVFMTNYSAAPLDAALFNENRYIYKLNGSLYLQPAWQHFQFEN